MKTVEWSKTLLWLCDAGKLPKPHQNTKGILCPKHQVALMGDCLGFACGLGHASWPITAASSVGTAPDDEWLPPYWGILAFACGCTGCALAMQPSVDAKDAKRDQVSSRSPRLFTKIGYAV